ncbi:MAG: hypothetical protein AB7U85_01285 [Alphaproteobacteria bacterium]
MSDAKDIKTPDSEKEQPKDELETEISPEEQEETTSEENDDTLKDEELSEEQEDDVPSEDLEDNSENLSDEETSKTSEKTEDTSENKKELVKIEKPAKEKKCSKGFFGCLFSLLTMFLWLFVVLIGTMPWWLSSPYIPQYVPQEIIKYLPPMPQAMVSQKVENPVAKGEATFSSDKLDVLEVQINAINNRVDNIEFNQVADLTKRVEQLELAKEVFKIDAANPDELLAQQNLEAKADAAVASSLKDLDTLKEKLENVSDKLEQLSTKTENVENSVSDIKNKETKDNKAKKEHDAEAQTSLNEMKANFAKAIEKRDQALSVISSISLLEDAFNYGASYTNELEILKNILGSPEEYQEDLTILEKHADTGIKPLGKLIKDFEDLAPEVAWASIKVKDDGIIGKVLIRLKDLVAFRRTGEKAPQNSTESIVDDAEKLVASGSIIEALKELDKLNDEDAKKIVQPWIEEAKAYTETKSTVRKITMRLVENAAKPI